MRIIARAALRAFWENPAYLDSRGPLLAWHAHVRHANWASPHDLRADFRNVRTLRDGRAIFNIAGNKYRLVVWINYTHRTVYIRFVGTHAQYDRIDAQNI
ncbi:MAG: type II toxin-antitoxin system HigB family toxin [Gammaproteobacteria bacterium]|nr:type II toxin-antitoxin system HigB family toxin [Gammaproteobacteria bacterium]